MGVQAAWLLDVSSRLSISEAEGAEYFSPEYLAAVPLVEINAVLAAVAGPTGWTPADICRAFAGLERQAATPGLEPVGDALSLEDGALLLDPDTWRQTWFKGGSELGVLTLNYLARTSDETYVVSAMVSDPSVALRPNAQQELKALIRGAFALAAGVPAALPTVADSLPRTHSPRGPSRVPFSFE